MCVCVCVISHGTGSGCMCDITDMGLVQGTSQSDRQQRRRKSAPGRSLVQLELAFHVIH